MSQEQSALALERNVAEWRSLSVLPVPSGLHLTAVTDPCCFPVETSTQGTPASLGLVCNGGTHLYELQALLMLMERKRLALSRGEVLLCAEVSEHGRGCSFLGGISH